MIPPIRNKFNKLPSPKYLNIINKVTAADARNPRLEFINTIERVKKSAKRTVRKKSGIAPFLCGSTKFMIPKDPTQRRTVIIKVAKKLFLNLVSFFLIMIFLLITYSMLL